MVEPLQLRRTHKDGDRVERIRLFVCVMRKLRDIRLPDFRDMIADAEAFLHIFYSLYEPAGSFPAGGILIRDTCRNGKTGQLFVDLLSVSFQKHRQDHRVRQTVRHIIFAAKRVGDRVDIPHVRFGKRASRVEGCMEHIAAGFHIAAVIVSSTLPPSL